MIANKNGKCVVFSAPSGAGKTTIVHHLLDQKIGLEFSVSACSRDPRPNEKDGKDYHFLGLEKFKENIKNNSFVEWEEVYTNNYYGTLKTEIQRIWDSGSAVIFDVDVVGGLNIKKQFKENALAIFVQPPSFNELENRLRSRSTETEDKINQRMSKAREELDKANEFDVVLINDNLENAFMEAKKNSGNFLKVMKVGLYFGSFNPVHVGHLIIANHMVNNSSLDQIWMVVSPQNPFKDKKSLLQDYHRLALVQIALEDNDKIKASDIEFKLKQPSYTIDTLTYLKEKHPEYEFSILMGEDNLRSFHKWKNYEVILKNHPIYIYPRVHTIQELNHETTPNGLPVVLNHKNINFCDEVPVMKISSSFIRKAIKAKQSIKYLVPERVEKYIEEMNFYK